MTHLWYSTVRVAVLASLASASFAQEIDNTQTLPDAKPGECYAKVITPAKFELQTEEVLVREEAERIEAIPAAYVDVEEKVVVRDEGRQLTAVEAEFESVDERIETRAAETRWTRSVGNEVLPVSPDALQGLTASGVEVEQVEPGTCFREYFTQAEYKSETIKVVTREASETVIITEADYETVEERVMVQAASSEVIDVPAVYRVETQSVLVEPARSVWKQGRGLVERIDNSTGEILCLVEVPARYETITKTVLDKPATTKTVSVPPVYETYERQRLVSPPRESRKPVPEESIEVVRQSKVREAGFFWLAKGAEPEGDGSYSGREICLTEQPAEYRTVNRLKLVSPATATAKRVPAEYLNVTLKQLDTPASQRRIPIPRRMRTVTSRVQLEPSRLEWRKVLCETNITQAIIADLQRALRREGFNPGPVDGVIGKGTMQAVEAYQLDNELDRGGLTYETLQRLKVES